MAWFFLSLIAPFIWAIVNHAEKAILSRLFDASGSGVIMVLTGFVSVPLAVFFLILDNSASTLRIGSALLLGFSGTFFSLGGYLYLKTLEHHDASYVVPYWQATPVFTYALAVLLLHEGLDTKKFVGGFIVLIGALSLSINRLKGRFNI